MPNFHSLIQTILVTTFFSQLKLKLFEGWKPQHKLEARSYPQELARALYAITTYSILFHLKTMRGILTKLHGNHFRIHYLKIVGNNTICPGS